MQFHAHGFRGGSAGGIHVLRCATKRDDGQVAPATDELYFDLYLPCPAGVLSSGACGKQEKRRQEVSATGLSERRQDLLRHLKDGVQLLWGSIQEGRTFDQVTGDNRLPRIQFQSQSPIGGAGTFHQTFLPIRTPVRPFDVTLAVTQATNASEPSRYVVIQNRLHPTFIEPSHKLL